VVVLFLGGCPLAWKLTHDSQKTPVHGFEVVQSFPHDPQAFSQGLVYDGGVLLEGTGKYGRSVLREVEPESGLVLRQCDLDPRVFGEGVAVFGDEVFQLTWKEGICFVYDRQTLDPKRHLRYRGEGWGLTHDGKRLIMSDGSSRLKFLDPRTFKVLGRLEVRDGRRPVDKLNELEFVGGEIWANVWTTDYIVRISPETGAVVGWVDLRGLLEPRPHKDAVLNGIAWDADNQRLFVTGKDWPRLFEIRLVAKP
jgi:glutamine cyclotransferase